MKVAIGTTIISVSHAPLLLLHTKPTRVPRTENAAALFKFISNRWSIRTTRAIGNSIHITSAIESRVFPPKPQPRFSGIICFITWTRVYIPSTPQNKRNTASMAIRYFLRRINTITVMKGIYGQIHMWKNTSMPVCRLSENKTEGSTNKEKTA